MPNPTFVPEMPPVPACVAYWEKVERKSHPIWGEDVDRAAILEAYKRAGEGREDVVGFQSLHCVPDFMFPTVVKLQFDVKEAFPLPDSSGAMPAVHMGDSALRDTLCIGASYDLVSTSSGSTCTCPEGSPLLGAFAYELQGAALVHSCPLSPAPTVSYVSPMGVMYDCHHCSSWGARCGLYNHVLPRAMRWRRGDHGDSILLSEATADVFESAPSMGETWEQFESRRLLWKEPTIQQISLRDKVLHFAGLDVVMDQQQGQPASSSTIVMSPGRSHMTGTPSRETSKSSAWGERSSQTMPAPSATLPTTSPTLAGSPSGHDSEALPVEPDEPNPEYDYFLLPPPLPTPTRRPRDDSSSEQAERPAQRKKQ